MEVLELAGIGEIKVRRSANIKYLRIRMAPGRGVWVSVPFGVSRKQVEKFLEENREWILKNRKETKLHVLRIVETEEPKPSYRLEQEKITLFIPKKVDFSKVEKIVQQFLLEIYTMECRRYLPQRIRNYAEKFGFRYGRVTFRNNISNWGSCSFDNNISLNIKLMKLPDEIIDYVILHELCHTVEKNHSAAFWKLVGKVCPAYPTLRARLRKYNTRI